MKTTLCSITLMVLFILNAVSQNTADLRIFNAQVASLNEDNTYNYNRLFDEEYDKKNPSSAFFGPSAIVANVSDAVKSVGFELTGPIEISTIESFAPYALFGDDFENLNVRDFPLGEYQLTVTPYEELRGGGLSGTPRVINFIITEDLFRFTDISLINADTDSIIRNIPLNQSSTRIITDDIQNTNLTVRPNFVGDNNDVIVQFEFLSPSEFQDITVDTEAPYSLYGDTNENYEGRVWPDSEFRLSDEYIILMTAYNGTISDGKKIDEASVSMFLQRSNAGLTLSNGRIDGDDLTRPFFPDYTSPVTLTVSSRNGLSGSDNVSSVFFELVGPVSVSQIVNAIGSTHSAFGYTEDGKLGTMLLTPGNYKLTATPYSGMNGEGARGSSISYNFELTDEIFESIIIDDLQVVTGTSNNVEPYNFEPLENNQVFNTKSGGLSFVSASSIIATINPRFVQSVVFDLKGATSIKSVENIFPFALFGDDDGTFNLKDFEPGNYELTVTPYSEKNGEGEIGFPKVINFTIDDKDQFEFTGFTVINADTDKALSQNRLLSRNTIINMDGLENTNLTIQADFKGNNKGVTVELREEFSQESRIEKFAPYVLDGNAGTDYQGKPITVSNTDFKIFRAIATRGEGEEKVIVDEFDEDIFFVSFNDLVSFSNFQIGNPVSEQTFDFLSTTYELGSRGRIGDGNVGIIVEDRFRISSPRLVNSVSFSLSGPINYSFIENDSQNNFFSLFGYTDSLFNTRQFVPGNYTFSATPYVGKNTTGYKGNTVRIEFSIVEEEGQNKLILFPNPANENTTLRTLKTIISAKLYNMQGLKVREFNNFKDGSSTVNTSDLPVGYYYLKSINNKGVVETEKLLIQH